MRLVRWMIAALAVALAAPTFAQSANPDPALASSVTVTVVTQPAVAATTFDFGNFGLHLNVSIAAFSYDFTHKAWLGSVPVTGLYVLTYKPWYDAGVGLGGSISFGTGSTSTGAGISGEGNIVVVSPRVSLGTAKFHLGLFYGREFGPVAANVGRIAPTVEF